MRHLLSPVLLAAAVFGMDAEAAVRVYRPPEPSQVGEGPYLLFRGLRSERVGLPLASVSVACVAAVWVGSRLAG
jgi:hypothetical protein